jgi:hypothetical protein
MVHPQVTDGGDNFCIRRVAANVLNKHLWTIDKGWFSRLRFGEGLTTPP